MQVFAPSDCATWIKEVEKVAPPSDRLSWLKVTWRPDWERWCVWQMIPPAAVPAMMWGPDTRLIVRAETILGNRLIRMAPDDRYRLILNRANMTRHAWALHLETGCYPQPFWVVQGHAGGHKWQFSEEESRLAEMHGFPGDPPEPGVFADPDKRLPYAPVDYRVVEKLVPLDMLQVWNGLSKAKDQLDERDLDNAEREAMQTGRWALWNWMQSQVDQVFEEAEVRVAGDPAYGYDDKDAGYEETLEQFITSED